MSRKLDTQESSGGHNISYASQRVAIFIDVQNMYYSAKNLFGAKVNFINVVKGAIRERQLIRATAYVVETPQQHEVRFLDALRLQGIELKERDLQVFSSGVKKADWDVGITVDAIRMSDKVDVIVLVSGDGDYIPLVEFLQHKGCKVEVMAFRNTSSSKLVEVVDEFIDLADDAGQYLINQHGGSPHHTARHPMHSDADEILPVLEEMVSEAAPEIVSPPRHKTHSAARDQNTSKKIMPRNKRTIM